MKGRVGPGRLAARSLAIAAAAGLATLPILDAAPAQVIGVNAAIRNQVLIRGAGTPQPRPAVLRQRVGLNDEVRTGGNSQLQILLLDRSVFTVGANARLTVDRFVFDPRRNVRAISASVTRGAFRFMSGRQLGLGSSTTSIRTPVATIGIRGTILEGVVGSEATAIAAGETAVGPRVEAGDDAAASLIVLRGPGPATQGHVRRGVIAVQTGAGTVTLDRPSLALYIPHRGAAPIGPFPISLAGLVRLQLLLAPAMPLALGIAGAASEPAGAGAGQAEPAAPSQAGGQQAGPAAGSAPLEDSAPLRAGANRASLWFFAGSVLVVLILAAASDDGSPRSP